MPTGTTPQLDAYNLNLQSTQSRLGGLRSDLEGFSTFVGRMKTLVELTDLVGEGSDLLVDLIDAQIKAAKTLKAAPPLKAAADIYAKILGFIKPVPEKIGGVVESINAFSPTEDFLSRLAEVLGNTQDRIDAEVVRIAATEDALGTVLPSTRGVAAALDKAADTADAAAFDALNASIEAQMAARNLAAEELPAIRKPIEDAIAEVLGLFDRIEIGEALSAGQVLRAVADDLSGVADKVGEALDKIRPFLDAFGTATAPFDAAAEFAIEKLGLADKIEEFEQEVRSKLPGAAFLDGFLASGEALEERLQTFVRDGFGITDYLQDIETALLTGVGDGRTGPTSFGTDAAETIGPDARAQAIDARGGDDTVLAGAGNDIILASEGVDTIDGGAGIDLVRFAGNFFEYELSALRDAAGDVEAILVTHLRPSGGRPDEGVEEVRNVEYFAFGNITFTGAELENALFGRVRLDGTPGDDLMFLSSDPGDGATLNVARGFAGHDRIFGSVEADRLEGGLGRDTLFGGLGDDELIGGPGEDIFQVLDADRSQNATVDLRPATPGNFGGSSAFTIEGRDRLSGIENVILQAPGDHTVFGNDAANRLLTAEGDDVVAGGAGDDRIGAGDGIDLLIGGAGRDRLDGGRGSDVLVVGDRAAAGQGQFYDGGGDTRLGADTDTLSYTNDDKLVIAAIMGPRSQSEEQTIRTVLSETTVADPGSVRIFAQTGVIERLDAAGRLIATDRALEIENFIGSDNDDVLHGAAGFVGATTSIHGAGGDDVLISNGASSVSGGEGNDRLVFTMADARFGADGLLASRPGFDGGSGTDTLDISRLGEARWLLQINGGGGRGVIEGFSTAKADGLVAGTSESLFDADVEGIERFTFGDTDDLLNDVRGQDSITLRVAHAGGGDDVYKSTPQSSFWAFHGQRGDDAAVFNSAGAFYGGSGDDRVIFDDASAGTGIALGRGDDIALLERYRGDTATGGRGYDTLVLDGGRTASTNFDMTGGRVLSKRNDGVVAVDTVATGFEAVFGTDGGRIIVSGTAGAELIAGADGRDILEGGAGDDLLYGGESSDSLNGGDGDDLLHGGAGRDILDGGRGSDTVSFANAVPAAPRNAGDEIEEGRFEAVGLREDRAGVTVDLADRLAIGADTEELVSIENAVGSSGHDTLSGDGGANVLSGGRGDDVIDGRGGDDVLLAGDGADRLSGGDGDDMLVAGRGTLVAEGGRGTDTLGLGGAGGLVRLDFARQSYAAFFEVEVPVWADTGTAEARFLTTSRRVTPEEVYRDDAQIALRPTDLIGIAGFGAGKDGSLDIVTRTEREAGSGSFAGIERVAGGAAAVEILVSGGRDVYDGRGSASDRLDLRGVSNVAYDMADGTTNAAILRGDDLRGIETVLGGAGDDAFWGTAAAERLVGGAGRDELTGRGGHDVLVGGGGRDLLRGGAGRDRLEGGWGNDRLMGGQGNDDLVGHGGRDALFGHGGRDVLDGRAGEDELYGGTGRDRLMGGSGDDRLWGQMGDDTLLGGWGRDTLLGQKGADVLYGGGGDDVLRGGEAKDRLFGGTGRDDLGGGAGDDRLMGGAGYDVIDGGRGRDVMWGGAGRDDFVFGRGDGRDVIRDFEVGRDRIDLSDTGLRRADVVLSRADGGRDTKIEFAGTIVILDGVRRAEIDDVGDLLQF